MKRQRENEGIESLDVANRLMMFSQPPEIMPHTSLSPEVFVCKTCNRKFSSFQALGGHRASHKMPKLDVEELRAEAKYLSLGMESKIKMHECSICIEEFSLGQALGGHMRRLGAATNEGFSSINQVVAKVSVLKRSISKRVFSLDLNLTPLENDLKLLLFGKMATKFHLSSF